MPRDYYIKYLFKGWDSEVSANLGVHELHLALRAYARLRSGLDGGLEYTKLYGPDGKLLIRTTFHDIMT